MIKPWQWIHRSFYKPEQWALRDGRGRERATIWQSAYDPKRFTWHTWDEYGTGGENAEATSLDDAKLFCLACIVRQGWAPGGWQVSWS